MPKKNNEMPNWLSKQKSIKTIFYEELNKITPKWKRDCFFELYGLNRKDPERTIGSIAEKYGKAYHYLSRWRNSEEYDRLAFMWSRVKYMDLVPRALEIIEDMLISGNQYKSVRYKVALDIVEKAGILKDRPKEKVGPKGDTYNINNIGSEAEIMKKVEEKRNRIANIVNGVVSE